MRRLIEEGALTQAAVARGVGISTKHVHEIVQGRALPSVTLTIELARFLQVDPRKLWHKVADQQLDRALEAAEPTPQ